MTQAVLGILGGSGVYDLPGLECLREQRVSTPWGEPSDCLRLGRIGATDIVFLSRHGPGHSRSPSGVNYRANIDALKRAGVTDLISLTACGSYREELPPGSFVLVNDFIDRTFKREVRSSCTAAALCTPCRSASPATDRACAAEGIPRTLGGTQACAWVTAVLDVRRVDLLQGAVASMAADMAWSRLAVGEVEWPRR
ncbi:MAG: hypothetical protein U1F35_09630 [Steroidobacteraceae bacterium]